MKRDTLVSVRAVLNVMSFDFCTVLYMFISFFKILFIFTADSDTDTESLSIRLIDIDTRTSTHVSIHPQRWSFNWERKRWREEKKSTDANKVQSINIIQIDSSKWNTIDFLCAIISFPEKKNPNTVLIFYLSLLDCICFLSPYAYKWSRKAWTLKISFKWKKADIVSVYRAEEWC